MNKNNFWKIIITLAIFIGLLIAGWFFVRNKPIEENEKQNWSQIQTRETSGWETYRNEEFGFEIKYPPSWQVHATNNPYDNVINIYKTGNPPFTHHSNITQVSIFPEGLGTEGPAGESIRLTADLTLAEENIVNKFVLSNNKKPFGYFINFKNAPLGREYGFIWASVEIKNQAYACRNKTKDMNTCEPLADGLDIIGNIDESEWDTVKEILSTFKFTK